MDFITKLTRAIRLNNSLLCVGLDTTPDRVPEGVDIFEFNKAIIDATSDIVCAYKPNLAFYEAMGVEGMTILEKTVSYIPKSIPIIGDAKRGDIGNTAKAYARALFMYFNFDAVTVNPYLGVDSLDPFLEYNDKGIFILCRTSNAGAADFQSLRCVTDEGTKPLFQIVAQKASRWNKSGNIGLVVGATYPEELQSIRDEHPEMLLLIPGIGAQGGNLELVLRYSLNTNYEGIIINSSRGIIYASKESDFAEAARSAAQDLRDRINRYRTADTP